MLSADAKGVIRIWDWASGKELAVMQADEEEVPKAVFSPNGKLVAKAERPLGPGTPAK